MPRSRHKQRSLRSRSPSPSRAWPERAVLLVDDDPDFRSGVAEYLRDDGHEVLECDDPMQIPPLDTIDLPAILLADYQQPGEDGLMLARRFHQAFPGVPIVLVTAYCTNDLEAQVTKLDFAHLLRKPLDYTVLHELLDRLMVGDTKPS
jgi:two-component system response regulator VanR